MTTKPCLGQLLDKAGIKPEAKYLIITDNDIFVMTGQEFLNWFREAYGEELFQTCREGEDKIYLDKYDEWEDRSFMEDLEEEFEEKDGAYYDFIQEQGIPPAWVLKWLKEAPVLRLKYQRLYDTCDSCYFWESYSFRFIPLDNLKAYRQGKWEIIRYSDPEKGAIHFEVYKDGKPYQPKRSLPLGHEVTIQEWFQLLEKEN